MIYGPAMVGKTSLAVRGSQRRIEGQRTPLRFQLHTWVLFWEDLRGELKEIQLNGEP